MPNALAHAVASFPSEIADNATELRLRLDAPASVTVGGKSLCFDRNGRFCLPQDAFHADSATIAECITLVSGGSLYSYGETIKKAYIPFGNGCRAGICGEGIVKNGVLTGFGRIYGINLRVRRFIREYGYEAARRISEKGLRGALVYSPPNCGKTTLLSSIAGLLSDGSVGKPLKVGVVDERGELFVPQLRNGLADALCGVEKPVAIELLCRSMSPQVLVCDELGAADGEPIRQVVGMGVAIVASAHAGSKEELFGRPFIAELLKHGVFPLLIKLKSDFSYSVEEYI